VSITAVGASAKSIAARSIPSNVTSHRSAPPNGLYSALAKVETANNAEAYALTNGQGANPAQRFGLRFNDSNAQIRFDDDSRFDIKLTAYGYGTALQSINAVTPNIDANRIDYRHSGLTEWYVNTALGVEQGFTLNEPPSGLQSGPLTLRLATGNVPLLLASDRQTVLIGDLNHVRLVYGPLSVTDAAGNNIPAWLGVEGNAINVQIDDINARYPLIVDPFVQQAELIAADGAPGDQLGTSVALSGDGTIALVGAPVHTANNHSSQGVAYVFTVSGGNWTQQAELTSSDGAANDQFGFSVALSGDGGVALISSATKIVHGQFGQGAAYIFTSSGGNWSQQAEFSSNDGAASD